VLSIAAQAARALTLSVALQAALSLALGGCLYALLAPREGLSGKRRVLAAGLLLLLAAQALSWCWALRAAGLYEISPAPAALETAVRLTLGAVLGTLAYAAISASLAVEGLAAGLLFSLLGAQAMVWLRILQAWKALGWFPGDFFPPSVAPLLALTCLLAAAALRHPEFRGYRWQGVLALLLLWGVPARVAVWQLKTSYGLRAPTLTADAGLPSASKAERVSLAWLYPSHGHAVRFEEKQAVAQGVEVSPESLAKLQAYLVSHDFHGVFARQALDALRQGWLFWWEPERALDAATLHRTGVAPPDYKTALSLLRGGQMDEERFRKLEVVAEAAAPRKEGFEDVNTSQLIFEGFASAYARFGDEESARRWLLRVDNLWPIYDKKIEVSPVETAHDCRVDGSLLVDGLPTTTVKVGLFYVASSTSAATLAGSLSQSHYPDERGQFAFGSLAPGTYYLGLMGLPSQLRGRILNPPGLIDLTPEAPVSRLDPIRVER
jgi:hypothetical protein